jgi:hypothetical protein
VSDKDKGYIYLDRKIRDHWLWEGLKPFSPQAAWIDILLQANYKDRKLPDKYGHVEVIKRGSFVTSIRILSRDWGWGKDRVSSYLKMLEDDGMISVRSDARGTLITVVNYAQYQKRRTPLRTYSRDAHKDADKDAHKDADPSLLTKGINSNQKKESAAHYDPLAGRRKRYDDL